MGSFTVAMSVFGVLCLLALTEATSPTASRMARKGSKLYLQVARAGRGGSGMNLRDGSVICPAKYPRGFTILCKGASRGTKKVMFSYNGRSLRTETSAPYTIAGDLKGNARPWRGFGNGGVIKCSTNKGQSASARVYFKCGGGEKPMQKPMQKKPMQKKPMNKPPMQQRADNSRPQPPAPAQASGRGPCVVINARTRADRLTKGWTVRGDGIIYKRCGGCHTIDKLPRPQSEIIKYRFKVPQDGHYAIAMDSRSTHQSEANDVGIAMRDPPLYIEGTGRRKTGPRTRVPYKMFKVYQWSAGRDERMSCRADLHLPGKGHRNGDSVSTGYLQAGRTYTLELGGRSHDMTVYHFVLWPCNPSRGECVDETKAWRDMRNKCRPF